MTYTLQEREGRKIRKIKGEEKYIKEEKIWPLQEHKLNFR